MLIVDGHAYAYRSFHAIRNLRSPDGTPTNAIFGFIKSIEKLRNLLQPSHLVIVWDGGLCAERMAALPEYKAQRPAMPADLDLQITELMAYLTAAGIASHCQAGVEADDWIATLARHAQTQMDQVVIASPDKDFMQLVNDKVGLLNAGTAEPVVWTAEHVRAKTGIEPNQVIDWLSLIGDSVDNIAGVPGIGPKNATKLLLEHRSLDNLYAGLDRIAPASLQARLRAAEATVRRNQKLIRLKEDLSASIALEEFKIKAEQAEQLRVLYTRWGFKSWVERLESKTLRQADLF